MKKVFLTVILSFVLLLCAAATDAATLTVTKTDDTNDGICNADCSLREAIAVSASGDTIQFVSPLFDTPQTIFLTLGELGTDKNITVNGKGKNLTRISGIDATRVFRVLTGGNLTLNNLSLINGRDVSFNAQGGAVFNGGNLTINDSIISNNSASGTNSSSATSYGGGIYNDDNCTLTLNNTIVSNNGFSGLSSNNFGGGIYNGFSATATITNSTIANNSANNIRTNAGIGIANSGYLILTGSTVSGNTVLNSFNDIKGGGIYNIGVASIINSTISGNRISASNFAFGGGIFNQQTVTIINSTVTQNSANSNLINPTACNGGGLYGGTIQAVNTIISANTSCFGSDINNSPGLNINNFIGGNAQLGTLADNGGATLTHALLAGSPAINAGSACVLTANACGFSHPALTTDQRGAGFVRNFNTAVDIGAVEDSITVSPSTLPIGRKNIAYSQALTASGGGGGPYNFTLESGALPLGITLSTSGTLSGTTAQEGTFNFQIRVAAPGGFVVRNYTLLIGYYVLNNNNIGAGSLRQLIADVASGDTISFDPAFFSTPRTIALGGSVLNINKSLTIAGPGVNLLTIDGENSTRVFSVSNPLTISGMRVIRGNGSGNVGGCILSNSSLNLTDVRVENCSSPSSGGGIFSNGSLNITNSTISNNTAPGAGGLFQGGGFTANVVSSTINNNTATSGGAGGIGNGGTVSVYLSTLYGNTAVFGGAATAGPMMIINNSTVSGNLATTNKAGGVYVGVGERLEMTNATVSNNVSNGNLTGGIYSDGGVIQMRNALVAGNRNGDGNAADVAGQILSFGWNLIGTSAGNSFASNSPTLTGNRVNVPANLAPLGNYGGGFLTHALLPNSQAINNGDPGNTGFAFDQRGVSRPVGAQDIGAFEANILFDQTTTSNGTLNVPYNQTLTVTRLAGQLSEKNDLPENLAPFTFALVSIAGQGLPNGLTLSPSGVISGTPTATGNFTFTVMATDTDGMAGVRQFTMQVNVTTSASVSISGKIVTANGEGIKNVQVTLTDLNGNSRTVTTGSFGNYLFENVESGAAYVISVSSKRYSFERSSQILTVTENAANVDFTARE